MPFDVALDGGRTTTANHYAAEKPAGVLFVFAHGAGAGQKHPFMVNTSKGLAARGIDVVTFDFPYMHAKRGAPDKPPVLERCFHAVIDASLALKGLARHALFIGGKSMGGRMATHLGAQDVKGLKGIAVLGYPLHPPGAPDKLRVAHLPSIAVPVLIVQGEKDAFGSPAEFAPHLKMMKASVALHPIAGADHSLTVRSKKGAEVFEGILTFVADWMRELANRRG
jgi:predicted alpha/beta-hydrolase family hydrolase